MNRFHIHVSVPNLQDSIRFYSGLFGHEPSVQKEDYAKWMLDDPRVNFAISTRSQKSGLDHLGIQVDSDEELAHLAERMTRSGIRVEAQPDATCCYAKSNKHWTIDPSGIPWEQFHSMTSVAMYGEDRAKDASDSLGACCITPMPTASLSSAGGCGSRASGCC